MKIHNAPGKQETLPAVASSDIVRNRIAESWGELPEKLGMIKRRFCHYIVWRFDLINMRTGVTVKSSNSETKLKIWAETHGWDIPNEKGQR